MNGAKNLVELKLQDGEISAVAFSTDRKKYVISHKQRTKTKIEGEGAGTVENLITITEFFGNDKDKKNYNRVRVYEESLENFFETMDKIKEALGR